MAEPWLNKLLKSKVAYLLQCFKSKSYFSLINLPNIVEGKKGVFKKAGDQEGDDGFSLLCVSQNPQSSEVSFGYCSSCFDATLLEVLSLANDGDTTTMQWSSSTLNNTSCCAEKAFDDIFS